MNDLKLLQAAVSERLSKVGQINSDMHSDTRKDLVAIGDPERELALAV